MPRIFVGLVEVAGYYTALTASLRDLGAPTTFVDLSEHPFQYGPGEADRLTRWTRAVLRRRAAVAASSPVRRLLWTGIEGMLRSLLLLRAVAKHDVFIFGFGSTFLGLPQVELPLLRLLGKRVIAVFHGSDARPPYVDGSLMARDRGRSVDACIALAARGKARVRAIDRWAHVVVENPLSGHFHERRCVHWLAMGVPVRPRRADIAPLPVSERVRILHAPSHPEAKGTPRIRAAIETLLAEGLPIEYIEVSGRPNAEVMRELANCDLVVDQLFSDTPMASFATEAAHFGKPALVGAYGAADFTRYIASEFIPPSAACHPADLERTLRRLVIEPDLRRALGARAQEFVRTRWAAGEVAARYLRLVDGDIPPEWTFDPADIRYVHGCAVDEERAQELVGGVLARGGPSALQLDDKPALREQFVRFAAGTGVSEA